MSSAVKFSPTAITRTIVRALAYRLALTDQALQQQLATFFPLEARKLGMGIYVHPPRVHLDEMANRIHLAADLEVHLPGQIKSSGHLEMAGTLVYVAGEGKFYLDRPEICELSLFSIPSRYLTPVRVLIRGLLTRFVMDVPIYQFRENSLRHRLARAVVRTVEVHRGKLRVRFAFSRRSAAARGERQP